MKPQNPHRLDQRDRHGASRRGVFSDTNTSFVVSTGLHVLLFMLLGIGGAKKVHDTVKLTEISYIEERYGQEVAKKVTVAPQKVAAVQAKPAEAPKLEGSIFAKAEPKGLPPQPELSDVPLPKPAPLEAPNPFAKAVLKSRQRRDAAPAVPRSSDEEVLLTAGLTENPKRVRMASEDVDLKGQVLVGRKSRLTESALFEVDDSGPGLAGGALTLSVPEGGVATGHADLRGGTLAEGKQAYQGQLPSGNLVTKDGSRDRLESLATLQKSGMPGGVGDGGPVGGGVVEPSRGTGLVSRGGADAVTRGGSLKASSGGPRPAELLAKTIAPPPAAEEEAAPAQPGPSAKAGKGVSMTLSGPILGREVLSSVAPDYPEDAKRQGWQGTVSVYFTVRPDGSIKKVFVEQASPYQVLDEAAKRCLEHWRFSPLPDGSTAEQWGVLTIVFRLR